MNPDEFEDISQPPPPGGGLFDPTLRPSGAEPQTEFAPERTPANGPSRRQPPRPARAAPAPFEPPSSFDAPESFSADSIDSGTASLRVPPHSVEAESSVLGGLLLDNSAWDRVGDLLRPDDFYRHEHRLVFVRISVAAGHSVRFLVDSGNGGTWTPVSALLDTLNLLQLDIESAAPTCNVGWSSGCEAG